MYVCHHILPLFVIFLTIVGAFTLYDPEQYHKVSLGQGNDDIMNATASTDDHFEAKKLDSPAISSEIDEDYYYDDPDPAKEAIDFPEEGKINFQQAINIPIVVLKAEEQNWLYLLLVFVRCVFHFRSCFSSY